MHYVGGLIFLPGPSLTEVRYRGENDAGAQLLQRRESQSEVLHRAGGKALHDDVGCPEHTPEDVSTVCALHVEGEAALAGVEVQEEAAGLTVGLDVGEGAEPSGLVAVGERLDLDDVGAEGGE